MNIRPGDKYERYEIRMFIAYLSNPDNFNESSGKGYMATLVNVSDVEIPLNANELRKLVFKHPKYTHVVWFYND